MNAVHAYASEATVVLSAIANDATTDASERYTDAQAASASTDTGDLWTVGIEDEFKLTVGSNSVTTTPGGHSGNATTLAGLEAALMAAWDAKYGSAGTASWSAIATILNDSGNTAGTFRVVSLQKDSGGVGLSVALEVTDNTHASGQTTRTAGNIGYTIGTTAATTDNETIPTTTGGGLIVSFESKIEGLTDAILTGITTAAVL